MSKLFEEAIADAKKLREIAEENAKRKIIDSMAPRIRQLIEQELVPDMDSDMGSDQEDDVSLGDLMLDMQPEEDVESGPDPTVVVNVDGTANIGISSEEVELADEDEGEDDLLVLNQESAMALANLISPRIRNKTIIEKIENLQTRFKKLDRYLSAINKNGKNVVLRESACKHYTQLLKEVISLRDNLIFTEVADANNRNVRTQLERLNKEIKQMSKRHAETLFRRLFEGDKSLEEFDVTFTDDELDALAGAEGPDDVEDELGAIFDDIEVVSDAGGEEPAEEEEAGEEEVDDLQEIELDIEEDVAVNIGDENQKSGINKNNLVHLISSCKEMGLDVIGLMCIPPANIDPEVYFKEMNKLNKIFGFSELSMGMSSDFILAVKHMSTYVRIGSSIFGQRS